MIGIEEAQTIVLSYAATLGIEKVDLLSSLGRVIGEEIIAPSDLPPWDNAIMDGFAVRFADIKAASPKIPVALRSVGLLPAGSLPTVPVGPFQAIRIMTGAPIPPGADTVVRKEDTICTGDAVQIMAAPHHGDNIRRQGENVKAGELVIHEGTPLRPPHIGMLASFSKTYVHVYLAPRVAILSTGNEVTDIDSSPGPSRIVNSNMYSLAAQVRECGARPIMMGIARDEKCELITKIKQGLRSADVMITTGGVAVGDYDLVGSALEEIGAEIRFRNAAMRPAKFTIFAIASDKLFFGLPGNPSSCMTAFEQLVRPALLKMMGHTHLFRPLVRAVLSERLKKRKGLRYFVRVRLYRKEGKVFATTAGEEGTGLIKSMVQADGLMIAPEDREEIKAGEEMLVQVLDRTVEF